MEKPDATDTVRAMLASAQSAETSADLEPVGTFAGQYAEAIKPSLTPENVEAFKDGATIINLLVQEAILRITSVAKEGLEECTTETDSAFTIGINEGAMMVARLMGANADALIQSCIEEPVIQGEFNQIVSNF